MNKLKWVLQLSVTALVSFGVAAQAPPTLTIATGGPAGTYSNMFKSIQTLCSDRVQLVEKNSNGSDENVDLLIDKKVDGAFVQPDTLQMASMNDPRAGPEQIRTLFPLYPEEVHIFALKDLSKNVGGWNIAGKNIGGAKTSLDSLSDLEGVKVGAWGGSYTTARAISYLGGVKYEPVQFEGQAQAFAALDKGEIAAVIAVGGQPLGWAKTLSSAKYKLLKIDGGLAAKVKVYQTAKLNYRNLNAAGLETVAPRALLVVKNYQGAEKRRALSDLRACVLEHEADFKEGTGHHPKWNDVDLKAEAVWPMYAVDRVAAPAEQLQPKKGKK